MEKTLTLVLPYYNERDYIARTLESLGKQSFRDFKVVLVDNGSTDGTLEVAKAAAARSPDTEFRFLHEETPGKIHALKRGMAGVTTPYVATIDADTLYPVDYLQRCVALFQANPAASSVFAIDLYDDAASASSRWRIWAVMALARLLPRKCHAGAYAQAFRTDCYRKCGGYDDQRWPYLLEDHEIVHRILAHGPVVYSASHYCFPSARRSDRSGVSWTAFERLVYALTPSRMMDWCFYAFLARRFARRGLGSARLRVRDW